MNDPYARPLCAAPSSTSSDANAPGSPHEDGGAECIAAATTVEAMGVALDGALALMRADHASLEAIERAREWFQKNIERARASESSRRRPPIPEPTDEELHAAVDGDRNLRLQEAARRGYEVFPDAAAFMGSHAVGFLKVAEEFGARAARAELRSRRAPARRVVAAHAARPRVQRSVKSPKAAPPPVVASAEAPVAGGDPPPPAGAPPAPSRAEFDALRALVDAQQADIAALRAELAEARRPLLEAPAVALAPVVTDGAVGALAERAAAFAADVQKAGGPRLRALKAATGALSTSGESPQFCGRDISLKEAAAIIGTKGADALRVSSARARPGDVYYWLRPGGSGRTSQGHVREDAARYVAALVAQTGDAFARGVAERTASFRALKVEKGERPTDRQAARLADVVAGRAETNRSEQKRTTLRSVDTDRHPSRP